MDLAKSAESAGRTGAEGGLQKVSSCIEGKRCFECAQKQAAGLREQKVQVMWSQ